MVCHYMCMHALPNIVITLNSVQSTGICLTGIALNGICSHTLSHVILPEPGEVYEHQHYYTSSSQTRTNLREVE